MPKQKRKPVVELKHPSYQPSVAELKEDIRIDASPEQLARALGRQVEVRHSEPAPSKRRKRAEC